MRAALLCAAAICAATVTHADTLPLACEGRAPDWRLDILGDNDARLQFGGRDTRFTIPQRATAEGRDWPRAMTLVARDSTAILVLDEGDCTLGDDSFPLTLHILTQRAETPILLSGCCAVAE